ncbi:MAG: hypothetical protein ACI84O_000254 [Myxococcota bacterium]|jgi:membrane protein implicated in regulation of membrane protease activity
MKWSIPPLLERYAAFFDSSPIWAVLLAIVVIALLLWLMRIAIRVFLFALVLLALVILASYFINGEDNTNDRIRESVEQSSEIIDQRLEKEQPKGD